MKLKKKFFKKMLKNKTIQIEYENESGILNEQSFFDNI